MTTWRYENPGRADLLTVANGTTITNSYHPNWLTLTGVAFYQPDRTACFGIAATDEIWLRCDIAVDPVNFANGNRIRIYHDGASGVCGFANPSTKSGKVCLWHNGTSKQGSKAMYLGGSYKPFWMHMKSGISDGVIEYAYNGATDSYTGNVNNAADFDNFYIQMDGANIYVSNLIISNAYVDIDDGRQEYLFDTEANIVSSSVLTIPFDTEAIILKGASFHFDTVADIVKSVTIPFDTCRNVSMPIEGGTTSDPDQSTEGLQNITIQLAEQQLTDKIAFVYAGDIPLLTGVDVTRLDYNMHGRVEEVSRKGVLSSCSVMTDIDELLYQQLSYRIPENSWEWTDEYLEYLQAHGGLTPRDPGYESADLKAQPSAKASTHISTIAAALGLNVSAHFTDYISTMSTEVQSGTNYAGLIEGLFGWTSRLPQLMINVFIRGNTLYVTQRGQEPNTVNLSGLNLTVHTVNKKLMRTTWGSDPWSKTEVEPFYYDWIEGSTAPLDDDSGGGGTTFDDDGLVEQTTVEHGDETVVTTYNYERGENGEKYLYQETSATYVNGSKVDEVVTYHEPVRDTQTQVYSVDDDGVIGSVVTSSNHDDRKTPFQGAHSSFQGGLTVTDADGNRYLLWRLTYHSDQGEKLRRTINGVALIDTSFPVDGQNTLEALTNAIIWLDRKTEESVTVDLYNYNHVIDFNDKIIWNGNTYYLRSNTVIKTETIVNKQSLEFVRWY